MSWTSTPARPGISEARVTNPRRSSSPRAKAGLKTPQITASFMRELRRKGGAAERSQDLVVEPGVRAHDQAVECVDVGTKAERRPVPARHDTAGPLGDRHCREDLGEGLAPADVHVDTSAGDVHEAPRA